MPGDHLLSRGVAGGVGIKAAEDRYAGGQEIYEPKGIRASAGRGDAAVIRMKGQATEGVDGRFAKDDGRRDWGRS
jgi:hypothetical protein